MKNPALLVVQENFKDFETVCDFLLAWLVSDSYSFELHGKITKKITNYWISQKLRSESQKLH